MCARLRSGHHSVLHIQQLLTCPNVDRLPFQRVWSGTTVGGLSGNRAWPGNARRPSYLNSQAGRAPPVLRTATWSKPGPKRDSSGGARHAWIATTSDLPLRIPDRRHIIHFISLPFLLFKFHRCFLIRAPERLSLPGPFHSRREVGGIGHGLERRRHAPLVYTVIIEPTQKKSVLNNVLFHS